jgi:hypothetical protein
MRENGMEREGEGLAEGRRVGKKWNCSRQS